jgi:hypothetical protein
MRGKIFLILSVVSLALFSQQQDEVILSIPTREEAHLDIEVTKLNIQLIKPSGLDSKNKIIAVNNISLNDSQVLLLEENPIIFEKLYSVNTKLPALREMARQTNLSYSQIGENQIEISYKEVPSKIFAAVWNRGKKVMEKVYEIDLSSPVNILVENVKFRATGLLEYISTRNPVEIELGELFNEGEEQCLYQLSNSTLSWTNGEETLKGHLYFRKSNGTTATQISTSDFSKTGGMKVILQIASISELKNYAQGKTKIDLSFPKELELVAIKNEKRLSNSSINLGTHLQGKSLEVPLGYSKLSLLQGETVADSIRIDHQELKKGEENYEAHSNIFSLVRENRKELLADSESKIHFSFSNDGDVVLKGQENNLNSIRGKLSVIPVSFSDGKESMKFSVKSSLDSGDVNGAKSDSYFGSSVLNIIIEN